MRAHRVLVALFYLSAIGFCQQSSQPTPILSGYVTRSVSGSDFDVNGLRILCDQDTRIESPAGDSYYGGCFEKTPVIGMHLDVYGHTKKKLHAVAAERIDIKQPHHDDISGYAVIDAVLGSNVVPGGLEFRADGYRMILTTQTETAFKPPLNGVHDVMANIWVEYEAKFGPDGVLILKSATFEQNIVSNREATMRAKTDYDPSAVSANANPNRASVTVGLGVDPKSIPPWPSQDEQDRLETIGQKLIPDWEKKLDSADPSRIDFRFQVTDGSHWPWVLALPSGVVLVPHEVVERMENDSQLAEILAEAIAGVLEKQSYRMRIANGLTKGSTIASLAEIIPVVGGPIALANIGAGTTAAVAQRKEEHQSERVSLWLMHDAGYDVDEAPVAWWLLESKKPKPVADIAMPERSEYLYRMLAEEWAQ